MNSKYHANQDGDEDKRPKESNTLVYIFILFRILYVKKKMLEMRNKEKERGRDLKKKNTVTEILEMQKKYLEASEQKFAQYSIEEIQRKL